MPFTGRRANTSTSPQRATAPTYHGVPPSWRNWKARFNWDGRAEAYDAELAEEDRQKRAREIGVMNDRHAALATAFLNQDLGRADCHDGKQR